MYVITGGGSGIGRALAQALAARDQQILLVGRHQERLHEVSRLHENIHYQTADVATESGRAFIQQAVLEHSIKGLIHNAGTLEPIAPLKEIKLEQWHQAFHTNCDPALFLTQSLWGKFTPQTRVLMIGTAAAYFPINGWAAYCCSKAALSMLTQCWQLESKTVAFASVKPGIVDTPMQARARLGGDMDETQVQFYRRLKEQNRLVPPETLALFLTWLLLDADKETYTAQEWDIYDTKHHEFWLKEPHTVPEI